MTSRTLDLEPRGPEKSSKQLRRAHTERQDTSIGLSNDPPCPLARSGALNCQGLSRRVPVFSSGADDPRPLQNGSATPTKPPR
eukprot:8787204-Pyramimonas_sp.AAC.1